MSVILYKVKKNEGFTLIELIIVITILGILVMIAVPRFFSIIEKSKIATDKANLRILNTATIYYGLTKTITNEDIFDGITSDEERMQILVDENHLNRIIEPKQKNASFKWDVQNQIWRLYINNEPVPLSPLGNTFQEISTGMISLLQNRFSSIGTYGRTWGDYRYTDIGLDPADWQEPINHVYYRPSGPDLLISPEEGYSFTVEDYQGNTRILPASYKWNIIYNDESKNWYYHLKNEDNILNIDTLKVVKY